MEKIDLKQYIYNRVIEGFQEWDFEDVYSVSFYLNCNDAYEYNDCINVPIFAISCNKESYFRDAYQRAIHYEDRHPDLKEIYTIDRRENGRYSELRWNYSDLENDEIWIFHIQDPEYAILFQWFKENHITEIGFEDLEYMYDNRIIHWKRSKWI